MSQHRFHRGAAAAGAVALLMTSWTPALAAEGSGELVWKPEWPTFRPAEYIVTGAAGAAWFLVYFALKDRSEPHWVGGILFDDAARDAFRLRSPSARDTARTLSDVTAVSTAVLAIGVDSVLVPLLRKDGSIALQLVLMDAEAFAVSGLLTSVTFRYSGRARPSYSDCQRDPSFDPYCNSSPTASFPSGHANAAFTAAGLSCAHHIYLGLYGEPWADAAACGGMITLATGVAALRVMGDRHYVSDVLVGSLVGFGLGFGLPAVLHYSAGGKLESGSIAITPMDGVSGIGLRASGTF